VALSVFALLKRFRPAAESIGLTAQQRYFLELTKHEVARSGKPDKIPDYLAIPGLLMVWMTPLIALFGIHLLLRGHDLPGGGFAAGITLTMALIVLYMARGARWVEAHLRVAPVRWIGTGLLLAMATGAAAMLAGAPFLTSWHGSVDVPVLGTLPLTSALVFDVGVFAAVVGSVSLI